MNFSLVNTVMKQVKMKRTRGFGSKPTYWASQASVKTESGTILGKCLRSSFYEKSEIQKTNPIDDPIIIMGYMGAEIEDGLIELIKREGLWENNNVKWQANGLSGEVDIIINVPLPSSYKSKHHKDVEIPLRKGQLIVESKSCHGYHANKEVFGYYEGRGSARSYVPGKPKIKHLLQSALYADISKDKTDGCLIIYVSRDEAKMTEFLVQVDDEGKIYVDGILELDFTMQNIYDRYESLDNHMQSDCLPLPDYKHTYNDESVKELSKLKIVSATALKNHLDGSKPYMDKECMYCSYRNLCMVDGNKEIKQYSTTINTNQSDDDLDDLISVAIEATEERPDYILHGSF